MDHADPLSAAVISIASANTPAAALPLSRRAEDSRRKSAGVVAAASSPSPLAAVSISISPSVGNGSKDKDVIGVLGRIGLIGGGLTVFLLVHRKLPQVRGRHTRRARY